MNETSQTGCQATPRLHPMLFDRLVTDQVIPLNPAHSVRGPKHSVKKGKTSVLSAEEMGILLKSISAQDEKTGAPVLIGLRDRARSSRSWATPSLASARRWT